MPAPILHYAPPAHHNRFILAAVLMFLWAGLQITLAVLLMFCGIIGGVVSAAAEPSLTAIALISLPFVGLAMILWGFHSAECGICLLRGQRVSLRGQRIAMRILECLAYACVLLPFVSGVRDGAWRSPSALMHVFILFLLYAAFAALATTTRLALRRAASHFSNPADPVLRVQNL